MHENCTAGTWKMLQYWTRTVHSVKALTLCLQVEKEVSPEVRLLIKYIHATYPKCCSHCKMNHFFLISFIFVRPIFSDLQAVTQQNILFKVCLRKQLLPEKHQISKLVSPLLNRAPCRWFADILTSVFVKCLKFIKLSSVSDAGYKLALQ